MLNRGLVPVNKSIRGLLVAAGIGAMTTLGACQSDADIDINALSFESEPADELYNQGLANLRSGKLQEASRKFEALDKQHPYSEYARKAMVNNSFANYRMGRYSTAINSARRYISLYPNSEDTAYAYYLIGLSYYKQIPRVTRDQRTARRSIAAFSEIIQRFPESEYVPDSEEKIRFARDQLAGKEMQVGRYYQERKEYAAAVNRFRVVVESYPNTRQIEEALARLVEVYYTMGLAQDAQAAAAVLGHNYPDSQWYADSYKLLQSGGLEPRENRGSWITRAGARLIGAES
ncbi:MAG: outer membrane protein assembly factor BamD [Hyphomicrobiales bacterium]|nr:outer membrane protein assembly factor BamD [Hyphomicrobiales bacterium]MCP4998124.1 outer membrane protein assembly factor BamD [Hyphomicrobiales bacterium]